MHLRHVPCRAGADGWWGASNDVAGDHCPHNVGDHKAQSTSYVVLGTLVSGLVSTSSSQASRWVRGSVAREWERVIVELGSDMMDGWGDGWMDGWIDRSNYNC